MPLLVLALCFGSGCLGAVVGVLLLFKLSKPKAQLTVDLVFKHDPICRGCGKALGSKALLEPLAEGSDTFDISITR